MLGEGRREGLHFTSLELCLGKEGTDADDTVSIGVDRRQEKDLQVVELGLPQFCRSQCWSGR